MSTVDEREAAGPEVLRAGSTFARYEIVRCIGVGGMGAVFEATHTLLRKRVALKTMHTNLGRSEASRARFLREAETVARIRHPNVVDISDLGIEDGVPFLVMEFLEGEDLARSLARRGPLSPKAAVDTVVPVAAGLAAVHRLGIVHRDIKPENVLLARHIHGEIVPKIIDFGVSKDVEASLRGGGPGLPHTVTGTPHYMSPEQARGSAALDGRTDQYALGIMLYQCVTGRLPYESSSLLELLHLIDTGDFTKVRSLRAEVPAELEVVIHRAMARHPRDRYPSMEAFGEALLPFASERVRLTHERDFTVRPMSTVETIAALDLHQQQSAATTPAGLAEAWGRDAPRTASGVREREGQATPLLAPHAASATTARVEAPPRRTGRLTWFLVGSLVVAAGLAGLVTWLAAAPARPSVRSAPAVAAPRSLRLRLAATPAEAVFELDGRVLGRGPLDHPVPQDGREHALRISAPGHEAQTLLFRDQAPSQALVELARVSAPPVGAAEPTPVGPPRAPLLKPQTKGRRAGRAEPTPPTPSLDIQLTR